MKFHIDVSTIENQVYSIILEKIRTRVYAPGFHLNEAVIAEELGVSRSPVREALKRLSGSNLIEIIPNKGAFVKAFTEKEIRDIWQTREMIELFAVRNITYPLTEEQRKILERYRKEFSETIGDQDKFLLLDVDFHAEIVGFLENSYIMHEYSELNWRINYIRDDKEREQSHLKTVHLGHLKVIDNMLAGYPEQAAIALEEHLHICDEVIFSV